MDKSKQIKSYDHSIIDISEYKKQKGFFYPENIENSENHQNKTIYIIWPTDFEDSKLIIEEMLKEHIIIMNLHGMEKDFAQRLMNFICGACYALNYIVSNISNDTFIISYNLIQTAQSAK